jgi:hypothetical protein
VTAVTARGSTWETYGYYVFLFPSSLWDDEPVFHSMAPPRVTATPESRLDYMTGCNREANDARLLPSHHAVKFGRPCQTCWPRTDVSPADVDQRGGQ